MTMDTGRSPDGSGHSALQPEPVSRLGHSASVPNAGQWALFRSYRAPEVRQIAKVTATLVKFAGNRWPRQKPKADIIACLDDEEAALKLAQSLAGASGHREKRIRKARDDFDERRASAWAEYERTEARLVASAIEARRAATENTGAVHESAGPQDDAQGTAA